MKTTDIPHELWLLKRSIIGSGIFGVLLPIYAQILEKSSKADTAGFALLVFAVIHYSYLRRLEKKLTILTPP